MSTAAADRPRNTMGKRNMREGTAEEAGMVAGGIERLRRLAAEWVETGRTPSLVLSVARRSVVVLHEAWGQSGPEEGAPPLSRDTIFPVSSITKPMTATLVMMLVEEGRLGLNRPVVDYLPELCGEGTQDVLVHHLLTHTSGFNEEELWRFTYERHKQGVRPPPCADETQHPLVHHLLSLRWPAPLAKQPGEEMSYGDQNYMLLGEIVRRVSGRPLEAFAHERLFAPLGMDDTFYMVPEAVRPRIVRRPPGAADYPGAGRFYRGIDSIQMQETPYGFSGVFSTAQDLAHFGQMFLDGGRHGSTRLLSPATVSEMTRNQIPGIGTEFANRCYREASWGLGWMVQSSERWKYFNGSLQSPGSFGHPGAGGAMLWIDPRYELVVVYLSIVMELTVNQEHLWDFDLFQNVVTAAVSD